MDSKPTIHPIVIKSHAETKAWNEYVIDFLGMRLDKRIGSDYKAMELYQGSLKLFEKFDFQNRRMANADMHKQLKRFLEGYLDHNEVFLGLTKSDYFKPPVSNINPEFPTNF